MRQGIIYDSAWGRMSGEVFIHLPQVSVDNVKLPIIQASIKTWSLPSFSLPSLPRISLPHLPSLPALEWEVTLPREIIRGTLQGVGIGLVIVSVVGVAYLAYPIAASELGYRVSQISRVFAQESAKDQVVKQEQLNRAQELEREQKEYAKALASQFGIENTQFSIYIPKINAKAKVVENVDPGDEEAYKAALKLGVAHAQGSPVPGAMGGSFIFAHSTNALWNVAQYNAVFYLLRELNPEDRDDVYVFYQDRVHRYKVAEKHIVPADDTSWLTGAHTGQERLVLQTCWPPGTTWKRLVVVAYPYQEETQQVSLNN